MRSIWTLLWGLLSWKACIAVSEPKLPIATCVAAVSGSHDATSFSFDCQLAAFGAYVSEEMEDLPVVLAPKSMLACSSLMTRGCEGAAVVVRRGDCSFQDKLEAVAAAGAAAMILVNTEDQALSLSSLEYEHSEAVAVSVTRSDGDHMIKLVAEKQEVASGASVVVKVTAPNSLVAQVHARLKFLTQINVPVMVFEEYQDFTSLLEPHIGSLDELLTLLATEEKLDNELVDVHTSGWNVEELEELLWWSSTQLSKWSFAKEAALHASAVAATIRAQALGKTAISQAKYAHLLVAINKLIGAGYYRQSQVLLEAILATPKKQKNKAVRCQLAFVKFLQGDVMGSLADSRACSKSQLNKIGSSVQVAQAAFGRLSKFKTTSTDRQCLEQAGGLVNESSREQCCYLAHGSTKRKANTRKFSSTFVEELFHSLVMMGVFLDELGSFPESLRFFEYASRICDCDRITLKLRQLLAVPIVFSSQDEMNGFVDTLQNELQSAIAAAESEESLLEREVTPLGDVEGSDESLDGNPLALPPENAAYLQYTITPSTMFIGYQGINVLPIQRAVNRLRTLVYPSLSSSFTPAELLEPAPSVNDHKRRVGFLSTWFRSHSVGKLLLGVVENLDRSKFHVTVYRCVHFLRDGDDLTEKFELAADEYVELPESLDAAVRVLRRARLDVVVYPELGMDEWTVLLSHHRLAPIQCVFWGHPITTGNPHIDYFISSRHFISEDFKDPSTTMDVPIQGEAHSATLSGYRRASFSEQLVLFRGLSTIFTEPKPLTSEAKGITRSRLHLPANRRLYVCPQTLMKLHPVFDEALAGILERDNKAIVVLLASETQQVWMEKLHRRFRRRFGQNARRVRFLPTLPFVEFQALLALADVLLDPFPFGGGVTTLDALHLGIPVVTLPAAQSVVHLAAGFLRSMNASNCIASSLDEYVTMAIAIAKDPRDVRSRLLAHRHEIYHDPGTIDDWNEFLSTVTPRKV